MNEKDSKNAEFWSYICGSHREKAYKEQFDAWFFSHYPWLEKWIPFDELTGSAVLEIGIGSGTVARRLAKTCDLQALDVAIEPLQKLEIADSKKHHGSVLSAPFEHETFDYVVSIGCVHHTGNPQLALSEIHRILKPGGGFSVMVYHKGSGKEERPELWDADPSGLGPPFTEWFTVSELVEMIYKAGFSHVEADVENFRSPNGVNVYAKAVK